MRIGRRAAAQEYQRLSLVCPQFVRDARWYDDAVPGANRGLFVAESYPAAPVGEQIDLLAPVVQWAMVALPGGTTASAKL